MDLKTAEFRAYSDALNAHAIVAKTDIQGRIIYVNSKFCEITGYTEQELLGRTHKIINSGYHSKDFFKNIWTTILSGQMWQGEIKIN